jgi:hypothetical protein
MPLQQVVRIKRQGRTVVTYRNTKGKTKVGVALAVTAQPVAPVMAAPVAVLSGGTLADGTYAFRASVTTTGAESLASVEQTVVVSGGAGAASINLSVTTVSGATAYKFYGRTAGAELLLVSQAGATYTDTGSATPAGALPTVAKALATIATRYSNFAPKSGVTAVPRGVALRGSTAMYFNRFGTPAGYPVPQRS